MRSAAAAIAFEFRRHHRWGLIALAVYFVALATIRLFVLQSGEDVAFDDEMTFAFAVMLPLSSTCLYFLAVFTYGLAGDLAARQSIYPSRMFTLPVTSAALAGWPMLYGAAGIAILWLATRLLGLWPAELNVPTLWPALLAASFLAWTQALTWMPYPLPGLRVVFTMLCLTVIEAIVLIALEYKAPEGVMLAILAPLIPLAYLTARFAVERARRGDVPDWAGVFARIGKIVHGLTRRRGHLPSSAAAQVWFEWRLHGRSLPALVGILLPLELGLLFLFGETPVIVFEILVAVLLTPPFMAAFVAATISKSSLPGADSYGVTPFVATRPMTSVSLISAKLKVTMWSAVASWLLVAVAIPIALRLSGTSSTVAGWFDRLSEAVGTPRAIVFVLLVVSLLLLSTWKQLVQSLYVGMSGREWVVKASVFVVLAFLALLFPFLHWILGERAMVAALLHALPSIFAVLVCIKICAAGWIAMRLHRDGVLRGRTIITGAACWDAAVFALYAVLQWLTPAMLFRAYLLAIIAILLVPLARVSAAPLALAWNRHR